MSSTFEIEIATPEKMVEYRKQAYACSPLREDQQPTGTRSDDNPIPKKIGDASPIKHIIYVIKENRTYDQVFGDMQRGNGDVGERQHDREPALGAQQPDDPTVDAEKFHSIRSAEPTNHVILSASEGSHRRLPRHEILRCAQDDSHFLHSSRKRSTVRTKKLTPNGMAMSLKS